MVGFRFLLGLGFGPKSATIPIYASECAPANVRGALVMFWQFFTAFGIMLGYICGAIFRGVLDGTNDMLCPQPQSPPPTSPPITSPEVPRKLLSIRCVSITLLASCRALPPAFPNLRDRQANLIIRNRASIGELWSPPL